MGYGHHPGISIWDVHMEHPPGMSDPYGTSICDMDTHMGYDLGCSPGMSDLSEISIHPGVHLHVG